MSKKLVWDQAGERLYETGVKKGVLYVQKTDDGTYPKGVAWNGLISVSEKPTGAEATALYADDIKYLNMMSQEEFEASIEAYTYPDEFEECDGSAELVTSGGVSLGQQIRKQFGMAYQTTIGNDLVGDEYGYKIHLIYGALASPSEKGYSTINDSPEAITLSWDLSTTPVEVAGFKPTATMIIDSTKVAPEKLTALENILFGTTETDARLPLPNEIKDLLGESITALELSTIAPADEETDVAVDATIVMTFNNPILTESVLVMANGALIAGTKSWSVDRKILTFMPAVNLNNGVEHHVIINSVSDIYAQTLAPSVKKFTTVA